MGQKGSGCKKEGFFLSSKETLTHGSTYTDRSPHGMYLADVKLRAVWEQAGSYSSSPVSQWPITVDEVDQVGLRSGRKKIRGTTEDGSERDNTNHLTMETSSLTLCSTSNGSAGSLRKQRKVPLSRPFPSYSMSNVLLLRSCPARLLTPTHLISQSRQRARVPQRR